MTDAPKFCDCIEKFQAELDLKHPDANTMLVTNLLGPPRAVLSTCKRHDRVRRKPSPIFASYCPFCGQKYPERVGEMERVVETRS